MNSQLHAPSRFTPGEGALGIHWVGSWVGRRARLEAVERRKTSCPSRELIIGRPVWSPSIYWLSYPGSIITPSQKSSLSAGMYRKLCLNLVCVCVCIIYTHARTHAHTQVFVQQTRGGGNGPFKGHGVPRNTVGNRCCQAVIHLSDNLSWGPPKLRQHRPHPYCAKTQKAESSSNIYLPQGRMIWNDYFTCFYIQLYFSWAQQKVVWSSDNWLVQARNRIHRVKEWFTLPQDGRTRREWVGPTWWCRHFWGEDVILCSQQCNRSLRHLD
jgi:hypothetical protein